MTYRIGIVVAVHPEDHSVDLVMADDGSRLVGVQVMTPNGSTRSGMVDLPSVPDKPNKWDIAQRTGQDMKAIVGFVGRNPVVTGFLYPQVNQMLVKDGKTMRYRHQSDVEFSIDGDGNTQVTHPSGTYIRIGESPDKADMAGKFADGSKTDRNTGKQVSVRVGLAGGKAVITISPDGKISMTTESDFGVDAKGDVSLKAKSATIDAPETTCTGNLTVDGKLTFKGGMAGSGGGANTATIDGSMHVTGDMTNDGQNSNHHVH
jgi:phage baseplate assembly protein gpV